MNKKEYEEIINKLNKHLNNKKSQLSSQYISSDYEDFKEKKNELEQFQKEFDEFFSKWWVKPFA